MYIMYSQYHFIIKKNVFIYFSFYNPKFKKLRSGYDYFWVHVSMIAPFIILMFSITFLQINKKLNIGGIIQSTMSRLRKRHHFNVDVQKRGSIFAQCIMCESFKDLILKLGKNNSDVQEYELKFL